MIKNKKSVVQRNGLVTLPAKMRKKLELKEGSEVEIRFTKRGILVKPVATDQEK